MDATARVHRGPWRSAPEEQSAIATAAEEFNIPAARRNRIVVTKVSERD
jgi:hypothetical protein